MPHSALLILYYTLVHPYLTYGIEAWYATYTNNTNKLFIMQKKSIRAINQLPYNEHTNAYFKQNRILKLEDQYKYQISLFMHKLTYGNTISLPNTTTRQQDIHTHNTRRKHHIALPQFTRSRSQHSVSYRGAVEWNSLPEDIKKLTDFNSFKINVRNNLLRNY